MRIRQEAIGNRQVARGQKAQGKKRKALTATPVITAATIWQVPEVCLYLNIKPRTFYSMKSTGRFGVEKLECSTDKALYYSAKEIIEWVEYGCPSKERWQAAKRHKRVGLIA